MNVFSQVDMTTLLAFSLAALVCSAGVVFLSGLFPADTRPNRLRGALAGLLIWTGLGVTVLLAAMALLTAIYHLPWAMAVVAGGSAFLLAPFVVQPLPPARRDSKLGALIYACAGAACLALLPLSTLLVA